MVPGEGAGLHARGEVGHPERRELARLIEGQNGAGAPVLDGSDGSGYIDPAVAPTGERAHAKARSGRLYDYLIYFVHRLAIPK